MDFTGVTDLVLAPFARFFDVGDRLSLVYQLIALLIAIGVYIRSRAASGGLHPAGLIRWLLPRDVLLHPSAVTDYGFFVANQILTAAIYGSIIITGTAWMEITGSALAYLFGEPGPGFAPSFWISAFVTLLLILVADATLWWVHYIFHVVPWLWEFHKVHHSAEVMTPITAARMHPFEEVFDNLVTGFTLGVTLGLLTYWLGPSMRFFGFFGQNIFMLAFFVAAFNLRHSHVWLSYPAWLQYIFVCPAQHHIHHSTQRRHWDRNMGFVFSFWDYLAGTLYITREKEEITFGLGTEEDGTWRGVGTLYIRPFRQSWQVLRRQWRGRGRGRAPAQAAQAPETLTSD